MMEEDGGVSAKEVAELKAELAEAKRAESANNAMSTAVMTVDRNFVIVYANRSTQAMLARYGDEFSLIWPDLRPDRIVGSSISLNHDPSLPRGLLSDPSGLPYRTDISVGPLRFSLGVNAAYDDRGQYVGATLEWLEITARYKQEQANLEYRHQIEAISKTQGVIEFTMDGTILMANDNFQRAMGYSQNELKGKHHSIFMSPAERHSPEYAAFWAALNRGEFQSGEFRRFAKNGQEVWIKGSYHPIVDAHGKPVKVVKFVDVITDMVKARTMLGEMVQTIGRMSNMIAAAAEEMTEVSSRLSDNARDTARQADTATVSSDQVATNVNVVAASSEEMMASIREISKSATEAARVARAAVGIAETTNQTIHQLGDSSQQIGKVIKVITSIAQQTNLLALNATIEAARAGESGKGFAVVANEVKELAKATALATGDIGQKIDAIQKSTQAAINAIAEVSQIINQVNDISNVIAAAVEEQTATTTEIGRNVSAAAMGTSEISTSIAAVARSAQLTTAGAADTQTAAKSLVDMAAQLTVIARESTSV